MTEVDQEFTLPRSAVEKLYEQGEVTVQSRGVSGALRPKTYRFVTEDDQ